MAKRKRSTDPALPSAPLRRPRALTPAERRRLEPVADRLRTCIRILGDCPHRTGIPDLRPAFSALLDELRLRGVQ